MKSDLKKAKDKAWSVFSKYIRLKYADKNGYCRCVSCNVKKYWTKDGMQAGHFIDSRNNSVLFDEDLVYPQCTACNMFKKGNKVPFTLFMVGKFGYKKVEEFYKLKFKTKKMSVGDFKEIENEYLDKIIGLEMKNEK